MARYTAEEVQKLLHIINRLQDQYDIRKEGNIYSTFQKKKYVLQIWPNWLMDWLHLRTNLRLVNVF